MARVVIIESDERDRRNYASGLSSEGFETLEASGSIEGLLLVLEFDPDLILLAEEMPPLQAADLLVILRRVTSAPIIVVGTGGEPEEIATLEEGADIYMSRGSPLRLLVVRIKALLRRYRPSDDSVTSFLGPRPAPSSLTTTQRRLLTCLGNHHGRPVSLPELRLEVWGGRVGIDAVKYQLRQLRHKLEREKCGLELLSVRGIGYRLVPAEPRARLEDEVA